MALTSAVSIVGIYMIYKGYQMTRPTYYLTISGSMPDDYTAAGLFILIIGVVVTLSSLAYIFKNHIRFSK